MSGVPQHRFIAPPTAEAERIERAMEIIFGATGSVAIEHIGDVVVLATSFGDCREFAAREPSEISARLSVAGFDYHDRVLVPVDGGYRLYFTLYLGGKP